MNRRTRGFAVALLIGVLAALGAVAPAAASMRVPRVVLVVGPGRVADGGVSAAGERCSAEAIEAGADVTRVYSPNATWPAVKRALAGRVDRRLPRARQRLAQHLPGRTLPADPERLRAQPGRGRRRRRPPVLRRGVGSMTSGSRPTRSCSCTTCATPAATASRGSGRIGGDVDPAGRQLRGLASSVPAPRPSWPRRSGPRVLCARAAPRPVSIEQIWRTSREEQRQRVRPRSERSPGFTERLDPDRPEAASTARSCRAA